MTTSRYIYGRLNNYIAQKVPQEFTINNIDVVSYRIINGVEHIRIIEAKGMDEPFGENQLRILKIFTINNIDVWIVYADYKKSDNNINLKVPIYIKNIKTNKVFIIRSNQEFEDWLLFKKEYL